MRVVFTATTGRSGSHFLSSAIRRFGRNCVAEHEPPGLLLARLGEYRFFERRNWFSPHSRWAQLGRFIQRRYFFTDEMLGRGQVFKWQENNECDKITALAQKRLQRIQRFERRGYQTYVEVSQFFIRSFAESTFKLYPEFALIKLTRDPIETAISLANRPKEILAGAPPPSARSNVLRINDWEHLTPFQIYLHRWLETELRFKHFQDDSGITDILFVRTEELGKIEALKNLFRFLDIETEHLKELEKTNTNAKLYAKKTSVSPKHILQYQQLLDLAPADLIGSIDYLKNYDPQRHFQEKD